MGATGGNGMGVFIYRNSPGSGTATLNNVQLLWDYSANGLLVTDKVTVKVFAIEMVYVPTGSFVLGSGGSESNAFYKYPTTTNTYTVSGEDVINVGTTTNYLWAAGYVESGTIPADFPKGYAAFYCMKYEISQGQYADFLNTITSAQASTRYYSTTSYRYTISGSHPNFTASSPDRACNYLSWMDGCAYADWAGLRPMTELEYEKACRGTTGATANEYAWGNANVANFIYTLSNNGQPNETVSNAASDPIGNASYGTTDGSISCGIFATGSSTRITAGASYYGVMEMSGNLWERLEILLVEHLRARLEMEP